MSAAKIRAHPKTLTAEPRMSVDANIYFRDFRGKEVTMSPTVLNCQWPNLLSSWLCCVPPTNAHRPLDTSIFTAIGKMNTDEANWLFLQRLDNSLWRLCNCVSTWLKSSFTFYILDPLLIIATSSAFFFFIFFASSLTAAILSLPWLYEIAHSYHIVGSTNIH